MPQPTVHTTDTAIGEAARPSLQSPHLALGNPSGATPEPINFDNFLIIGNGLVISYNNSRGTANWVAWRTSLSDLGDNLARPRFEVDPRLPKNFNLIQHRDYSGSGYDRGHLVPSADRFGDAALNAETFLMTNIAPQTRSLNQYPWQRFEAYSRGLVRRGNDVYSIAGVYGGSGRLRTRVTVPTNFWKIMVAVPAGSDLYSAEVVLQVVAVDMPNVPNIDNSAWQDYRVTIAELEKRTGLRFFAELPVSLREGLIELSRQR
ncbi:MAG: DNA/RNA non-specific endonuclease [Blastocatellia bacterium]|nr:DNA/RNA non-specific endonuclease [Blastocatellia bacterium]